MGLSWIALETTKPPEKECKHGSVQLVGEIANYTGRLEFCAHGKWGKVCNSPFLWGLENAQVVCRQLGFPEEGRKGVWSANEANTITP